MKFYPCIIDGRHCALKFGSGAVATGRREGTKQTMASYRNRAPARSLSNLAAFQPIQRIENILHELSNGLVVLRLPCRDAAGGVAACVARGRKL